MTLEHPLACASWAFGVATVLVQACWTSPNDWSVPEDFAEPARSRQQQPVRTAASFARVMPTYIEGAFVEALILSMLLCGSCPASTPTMNKEMQRLQTFAVQVIWGHRHCRDVASECVSSGESWGQQIAGTARAFLHRANQLASSSITGAAALRILDLAVRCSAGRASTVISTRSAARAGATARAGRDRLAQLADDEARRELLSTPLPAPLREAWRQQQSRRALQRRCAAMPLLSRSLKIVSSSRPKAARSSRTRASSHVPAQPPPSKTPRSHRDRQHSSHR